MLGCYRIRVHCLSLEYYILPFCWTHYPETDSEQGRQARDNTTFRGLRATTSFNMSLVNLAHLCSHLQNASLARLGITSVPYTKLHLSLSLLLHKQGFLSQVKLGGPSPPSAFFGASVADNHHMSSAPHRVRDPKSGEAALHDVVYNGMSARELRRAGYPAEAVQFALEMRELSKEQLEAEGWDAKAVDFLLEHSGKSDEETAEEGLDERAKQILRKYSLDNAMQQLRHELDVENTTRQSQGSSVRMREEDLTSPQIEQRLRHILRKNGFDKPTLQYFAGPAAYATPRHLEQDGVTLSAMGLDIPNQPITTLPQAYRDPWHLESESLVTQSNRASRRLWLGLKYWDGVPVLKKARLISKPTKRIWLNSHELGKIVRGGQAGEVKGMHQVGEVMAVSTDKGVMEARECVERRIGGQVLCRVW